MIENEWISFEKSGKVSDYLAYCMSSADRFGGCVQETAKRWEGQNGADMCSDGDRAERSSGRGI